MFWIGLPLVIVGQAIRIWSSGYLNKMDELITAGPFAIGRNPLYIGSFFISLGYFVMCNQPVIWVLGPVLFWVFHCGAIIYEEQMLLDKFGDSFRKYCKSVPRWISWPRSLTGEGEFTLQQLLLNKEYKGTIGTVITIMLFAILAYTPGLVTPLHLLISRF